MHQGSAARTMAVPGVQITQKEKEYDRNER